MTRNQCHIQNCQKKDHKDCKKPCHKKERFDSWSESSDSCNEPRCYKQCYRICTVKCQQKRCEDKRWGFKVREEESCKEICEPPKLHQKCGKNNHGRKH